MSATYSMQKFGNGYAICKFENGRRISRRRLVSRNPIHAAEEFKQILRELKRPKEQSVKDLWGLYIKEHEGRRIAHNLEFTGRRVLPFFGERRPGDITIQDCRDYMIERRKLGVQDGTILTEMARLRLVLKWAEKHGHIERAPYIEKPSAPPPKSVFLTREQAIRLLDAADMPHVKLFIHLALGTAGRREALLTLTWDRVDFDRGIIYLGDPQFRGRKKGRATVPMNDTLRKELEEAKRGARTPYVIEWAGRRVGSIKRALAAACKRSGVYASPHVFRHTAAVWLAESGRPMPEIAQYLGHADDRITQRVYARYSPDHLKGSAGVLDLGCSLGS